MGLCALVLCATPVAAHAGTEVDLGSKLAHHLASMRKDASVIRFFESHPWLLSDPRVRKEAASRLRIARRHLAVTRAKASRARATLERERRQRRLLTSTRTPETAICTVFGPHCQQALQVARCESGLETTAQNGQYLGLFQMGSSARRLFGHGPSPLAQAQAAHRYFVQSGRDWSPWSCKPWG